MHSRISSRIYNIHSSDRSPANLRVGARVKCRPLKWVRFVELECLLPKSTNTLWFSTLWVAISTTMPSRQNSKCQRISLLLHTIEDSSRRQTTSSHSMSLPSLPILWSSRCQRLLVDAECMRKCGPVPMSSLNPIVASIDQISGGGRRKIGVKSLRMVKVSIRPSSWRLSIELAMFARNATGSNGAVDVSSSPLMHQSLMRTW